MSKAIQQTFGDISVLILSEDMPDLKVSGETGIKKTSSDGIDHIWKVVEGIALDLGRKFEAVREKTMPQEVEVEFGLTFAEKLNLWAVKTDAGQSIKVKLKWTRK